MSSYFLLTLRVLEGLTPHCLSLSSSELLSSLINLLDRLLSLLGGRATFLLSSFSGCSQSHIDLMSPSVSVQIKRFVAAFQTAANVLPRAALLLLLIAVPQDTRPLPQFEAARQRL